VALGRIPGRVLLKPAYPPSASGHDHSRRNDPALFSLTSHGGPLWDRLHYAQIGGLSIATFIALGLAPVFRTVAVRGLQWDSPAAHAVSVSPDLVAEREAGGTEMQMARSSAAAIGRWRVSSNLRS
jgi:hypothetical protein